MRILGFVLKVIGGLVLAALIAFLFGLLVQYLWNWLMPGLFHFPEVSFWQAAGLVLLSRLLFGNIGGGHHGRHPGQCRRKASGDKDFECRDEWCREGGEESLESSRQARCVGWGWWSWWKTSGKGHYEAWRGGKDR